MRLQTLALIPRYSKIKPVDPSNSYTIDSATESLASDEDEFDFASTLIIFSDIKTIDLSNRFRKDADAYFVEAKRSTVSSVAQIPLWIYGVLVVLGWNEAMAVLFNPLYFATLLIGLASACVLSYFPVLMPILTSFTSYIVWQLGLTGPLLQVTKTVATEVSAQTHDDDPQVLTSIFRFNARLATNFGITSLSPSLLSPYATRLDHRQNGL